MICQKLIQPSKQYWSESTVLQYFVKLRYNSDALDSFSEVVNITNHSGLLDILFAWNSPSATHRICSLPCSTASKSTVLSLPDFARESRFSQPKWNFLNYLVTVQGLTTRSYFTRQIFFPRRYDLIRIHKVLVPKLDYTARLSNRIGSEDTACQRTSCHDTINYNGYPQQLELLCSFNIRAAN